MKVGNGMLRYLATLIHKSSVDLTRRSVNHVLELLLIARFDTKLDPSGFIVRHHLDIASKDEEY